jgi:hypothetical protein
MVPQKSFNDYNHLTGNQILTEITADCVLASGCSVNGERHQASSVSVVTLTSMSLEPAKGL